MCLCMRARVSEKLQAYANEFAFLHTGAYMHVCECVFVRERNDNCLDCEGCKFAVGVL